MSSLKEIDALKAELDLLRPIPPSILHSLREHLMVEWTYHSNSIEGNTLTIYETKAVLEYGITIGGKSLKEHVEVINHRSAIHFLEDLVKEGQNLTERTIKDIHSLVLRGIDDKNAGTYRNQNVLISGAIHRPPDHLFVKEEMQKLIEYYYGEGQNIHPVERAAILHSWFVKIHPFVDGNGRTARLLLNFELMKTGYVPIVIRVDQRIRYYESLDKHHITGDATDFIDLVLDLLEDQLKVYLDIVK